MMVDWGIRMVDRTKIGNAMFINLLACVILSNGCSNNPVKPVADKKLLCAVKDCIAYLIAKNNVVRK